MTKTRYTYLENDKVLADSGEETFNIDTEDVITRLDFEVKATNGATNNQNATMADVLTSLELMNGSEPIISLSGKELAGILPYRTGKFNNGKISEAPGDVQTLRFPVDFGRWYGDEQMALDLSRFNKLQVRYKWNLAAINAVGATGFVTATGRFSCIAHILEGGATPLGYLSLKRHALFTTAASGEEKVDLPTDRKVRAIAIRSHEAGTGSLSGISNVEVNINEGKDVPIDLAVDDLLDLIVNNIDPFVYKHVFHKADDDVLYMLLKKDEQVNLNAENILATARYTNTGIGEGALMLATATTGADLDNDTLIDAIVAGYLPYSTAYIPFGVFDDPNTWLSAELMKKLRVILTQDNAGADCSVMVEQLNQY